jgi:hypothetical protein
MMHKCFKSYSVICYHSLLIHNIGRALEFQNEIDDFIEHNCDLRYLELNENEWAAITQVV